MAEKPSILRFLASKITK
jgi:putative transposase